MELSARYDTAKVTIIIETTKLLAKKFRKKLCEGELWRKGGCLRNMIIPTKGRKFRRKYASDKEPTITRTYKSFFSKKSIKVSFWGIE